MRPREYKNMHTFLFAHCMRYAGNTALTDGDNPAHTYTYRELHEYVDRAVSYLTERGLRKGDRFGIISYNRIEFFILYLASLELGTLLMPLVADLPASSIADLRERYDIKLLFYGEEQRTAVFGAYNERIGNTDALIPLDSLETLLSAYRSADERTERVPRTEPGVVYFTSGTTGAPKGVAQSPENLLTAAERQAEAYGFGENDIQMGILFQYHTALTGNSFFPCFLVGGTLVVFKQFRRSTFWRDLSQSRASYVNVVPTILTMLLNTPEDISRRDLSRLKYIGSGSSLLSGNLQTQFEKRFGVSIANLYGSSESGALFFHSPYEKKRVFGAIGKPLSEVVIALRDEAGNDVPTGEIGEVLVKVNPSVIRGYYQNPEETARSFKDGWFHIGDLARRQDDGVYVLVGRKKELVNRGGAKVYPQEVDNVLLSYTEAVLDAASVGVPDAVYGEDLVAFVVPRGETPDAKDILAHAKQHLPPYKCPREIIFVDELPKTASGKLFRLRLQSLYTEEYGIEIRTARKDEQNELIEFHTKAHRPDHPLAHGAFLNWWLGENPYFRDDLFSCKIALHKGTIIGHLAFMPIRLWANGEVREAAWGGNLVVDERYRGRGIGGKLVRSVMKERDAFMDLGASETGTHIQQKEGWTYLGMLSRAIGVLDASAAQQFTAEEGLPARCLIKNTIKRETGNYTIQAVARCGEDFDAFWEKIKGTFTYSGERSSTYLNWRYGDHPVFNYTILRVKRKEEMRGFAVLRLIDVSGSSARVVRLTEFLAFSDAQEALLSQVIAWARTNRAVLIDFAGASRASTSFFGKHGFCVSPDADRFTTFYQPIDLTRTTDRFSGWHSPGKFASKQFNDREKWYVTSGDGVQDRPNTL